MLSVNEKDIDKITEVFYLLLKGKVPSPIVLPDDYPENEIWQAVTYINRFINEYNHATDITYALSRGELLMEKGRRGKLLIHQSLKSLQASLSALTWTTQQIAKGDFSQKVSFMGDFSDAFNQMTAQLKNSFQEREKGNKLLQEQVSELGRARRAMLNIMEDLEEAKQKAELATKAKGDFLANMSHEIRTPMNAVIGMSHLAMKTNLSPKQKDYISKILISAKNLLGIINDILDFSKIEAGKLSIESIPFDMNEVIDNLSNTVTLKANEKNLELVFVIAPEMPMKLVGDPLRVGQILLNLCNNAIKFTDEGSIVLSIAPVTVGETSATLKFSVKDSGIGLSPEQQSKLFQSFQQADSSTTRKFGGTGLGLAISKKLTEMMGGEIGVSSQLNQGATFFFTAQFGVQENLPAQSLVIPGKLQNIQVLIVDDNQTALDALSCYLSSFGFQPRGVSSGEAALSDLRQSHREGEKMVDLILMDWLMPGLNGIETSRLIRNEFKEASPKIIMVTAHGREDIMQQAEDIRLDGFLLKPVTQSLLFDAIISAFGYEVHHKDRFDSDTANLPEGFDLIRGARILLVDDNNINQQVATELLELEGFFITIANNGKEAMQMVTTAPKKFDAILMDLQMPVMDGYEATEKIRSQKVTTPIIAMTADAMSGVQEKVLEIGMNDYVTKPISPLELFKSLVTWIPAGTRKLPDSYQSQEKKESNQKSPSASKELPFTELPGIDINLGLTRTNKNKKLYFDIILKFYDANQHAIEEIESHLSKSDHKTAQRMAHTIKGVAGNIGAVDLQKKAGLLEAAIANRETETYLDLIRDFAEELNHILTTLAPYVKKEQNTNQQNTDKPQPWKKEITDQDYKFLGKLLNRILPQLKKRKPKVCKEIMAEIMACQWTDEYAGQVQQLDTLVRKYKFKEAMNIAEEMLIRLDNILMTN